MQVKSTLKEKYIPLSPVATVRFDDFEEPDSFPLRI